MTQKIDESGRLKVTVALLVGFFVSFPFAYAQTQYWTSLASFQSPERAQRGVESLAQSLAMDLSVRVASSSSGTVYRVVSGPFSNRSQAQTVVDQAQVRGVDGAWVWSESSESAAVSETLSLDLDENFDLQDSEFTFEPNRLDDEAQFIDEEVPTLVEEAPANYKLNRLRRDSD